jgi:hypothetical protein
MPPEKTILIYLRLAAQTLRGFFDKAKSENYEFSKEKLDKSRHFA